MLPSSQSLTLPYIIHHHTKLIFQRKFQTKPLLGVNRNSNSDRKRGFRLCCSCKKMFCTFAVLRRVCTKEFSCIFWFPFKRCNCTFYLLEISKAWLTLRRKLKRKKRRKWGIRYEKKPRGHWRKMFFLVFSAFVILS